MVPGARGQPPRVETGVSLPIAKQAKCVPFFSMRSAVGKSGESAERPRVPAAKRRSRNVREPGIGRRERGSGRKNRGREIQEGPRLRAEREVRRKFTASVENPPTEGEFPPIRNPETGGLVGGPFGFGLGRGRSAAHGFSTAGRGDNPPRTAGIPDRISRRRTGCRTRSTFPHPRTAACAPPAPPASGVRRRCGFSWGRPR